MATKILVLVLDCHPLARKGIESLLAKEKDFSIAGSTGETQAALDLLKSGSIDIAIIDQDLLDGGDSIQIISDLHETRPDIRILAMTLLDGDLYGHRVREAGADGLYVKTEPLNNFLKAIRKIQSGKQSFSSPGQLKSMPLSELSDSELAVFESLGRGFNTSEIAEQRGRSVKTIQTYCFRMRHKLGIKDAKALLQAAREWVGG